MRISLQERQQTLRLSESNPALEISNTIRIPHDGSISAKEAVRKSADDHGMGQQVALKRGMLENTKLFVGMGAEVAGNV